jgi:hypothetical protein
VTAASSSNATRQRRVQRFVVGLAMSVVVFVLERIVMRAIKRGQAG